MLAAAARHVNGCSVDSCGEARERVDGLSQASLGVSPDPRMAGRALQRKIPFTAPNPPPRLQLGWVQASFSMR